MAKKSTDPDMATAEDLSEGLLSRLEFFPVPFFRTPLTWFLLFSPLGCVAGIVAGIVAGAGTPRALLSPPLLLFTLAFFLLAYGWLCFKYYTRPRSCPPILLYRDGIRIPQKLGSKKTLSLSYPEITSIDVRGNEKRKLLVIGTDRKAYWYPLRYCAVDAETLMQAFASAFRQSPEGADSWRRLQEKQVLAEKLMSVKPVATNSLVIVMALAYLLELLLGAGSNPFALIAMGANAPLLVGEGQWSRIFTANFLHLGLLHIYFNGLAILILGSVLEKMIGRRKYLIIFLLGCIVGSLSSSLYASAVFSVGSSTGVFALLGALAYINLRWYKILPAGFHFSWQWWFFILGLNGLLPFLLPQIDWIAHLGGFTAGVVLVYCLVPKHPLSSQRAEEVLGFRQQDGPVVKFTVGLVVLLFFLAFGDMVLRLDEAGQNQEKVMAQLLSQGPIEPGLANAMAWSIAIDKNPSSNALVFARELMEPVVSQVRRGEIGAGESAAYLDTMASIHYLGGNYHQAVMMEFEAMKFRYKPDYASQLSRFIAARNAELGPFSLGEVGLREFVAQAVEADMPDQGFTVILRRSEENNTPAAVLIHVYEGQQRKGYFYCGFQTVKRMEMFSGETLWKSAIADLAFVIEMADASVSVPAAIVDSCRQTRVDGKADIN